MKRIILALFAVLVLAGCTATDSGDLRNTLPDTCTLGGQADVVCEEMSLADGQLRLGIRNTGQRPIEELELTITSEEFTMQSSPVSADQPLEPGEITIATFDLPAEYQGGDVRGGTHMRYRLVDAAIPQETVGSIRVRG